MYRLDDENINNININMNNSSNNLENREMNSDNIIIPMYKKNNSFSFDFTCSFESFLF